MASITIFHFQLIHTTKDQRLELSSNGFHSEHQLLHQTTNQTTMVSQLSSESSTATTTQLNEETSLSKIDEKIKKSAPTAVWAARIRCVAGTAWFHSPLASRVRRRLGMAAGGGELPPAPASTSPCLK